MEVHKTKIRRLEKKIINNVLHLFDLYDDHYWIFTRYMSMKFKNNRCVAMDIYQRSISIAVGDRNEFYMWLSAELNNYFSKLPKDNTIQFNPIKNFSRNLTYYLFEKCAKYSLAEYCFPKGKDLVFKHIIDFIENKN